MDFPLMPANSEDTLNLTMCYAVISRHVRADWMAVEMSNFYPIASFAWRQLYAFTMIPRDPGFLTVADTCSVIDALLTTMDPETFPRHLRIGRAHLLRSLEYCFNSGLTVLPQYQLVSSDVCILDADF